jgi:hypothetical protein
MKLKLSKKYDYEWLVIILIHDFRSPKFSPIIRDIREEFRATGVANHNYVLFIHDHLIDSTTGTFKTSFEKLVPSTKDPMDFCFETVTEINFHFEDGRSWTEILKWINSNINSRQTALITLSEGAGYGILGEGIPADGFLKAKFRYIPVHYLNKNYFSMSEDSRFINRIELLQQGDLVRITTSEKDPICNALEILWISELVDALNAGFGERRIDILMMSNCFMQTFETGWMLRKNVKYFIAPETLIQAYGYSYKGLLENINSNIGIKASEIVKTVRGDFVKKWLLDPGVEMLNYVSVMVSNLKYYNILKLLFEIIAFRLNKSNKPAKDIVRVRQEKFMNVTRNLKEDGGDSGKVDLIDLNYFYEEMVKAFPKDIILRISVKLFSALTAYLIRKELCHVGQAFTSFDEINSKKFRLQGFSIFIPGNLWSTENATISNCAYFGRSIIKHAEDGDNPMHNFLKDSQWNAFIEKVLSQYQPIS